MAWLEDKLAPSYSRGNWKRDLLGLALLAGLMAILLPGWDPAQQRYLTDIAGQMAAPGLLMAMGWLVAMRCGAIDLSVWVVAGVAGTTAAAAIAAGMSPRLAFLMAIALGGVIGLVNGLLVAKARLPSALATLAVGVAVILVGQGVFSRARVRIPEGALQDWIIVVSTPADTSADADMADQPTDGAETFAYPLIVTRIVIVLCAYVAVMFTALRQRRRPPGRRGASSMVVSLTVCGMLAALAGACRLIDHGSAAMPARPIGDLRAPAAAILAGGLFFAGPNRAKLAGLCTPIALLAATIWRQRVWQLGIWGYEWQVLLLLVLAVFFHAASKAVFARHRRARRSAELSVGLQAVGMAMLAGASVVDGHALRVLCRAAGLLLCVAGVALLQAFRRAERQRSRIG